MKKTIFLLLICMIFISLSAEYKIFSGDKELDIPLLAKKLQSYDVIFFGEIHDDSLLHRLELELLQQLYKQNSRICVSLEMFERDVQPLLDSYLQNDINETEFLQKSRAWPNYSTDYKPLIEFAKQHSLPVLAANVPRRYAAMLNKQGKVALDNLPAAEQKFIADSLVVLDDEYKERFLQTMAANMGMQHVSQMHRKMLESVYAAQCLKDDTMAESITNYRQEHADTKVIHYNGEFHSDYHLGTAQKLKLLEPQLKIAVIASQPLAPGSQLEVNDKQKGDFIIVFHRKPKAEQRTMPRFKHE